MVARKKYVPSFVRGTRVHLRYNPDARGKITQEGPEQSSVKWDNGNETIVVNTWVVEDFD